MSEMRTMASSSATATKSAGGKGGDAADAAAAEGKKGGKKKLLLIVVVGLLVLAGAAYWFLLRGGSAQASEKKAPPKPELGAVLPVDPISINLADGHYLKLGIALQQTKAVKENVDGSRALDAAISLYSGRPMAELSDPAKRDAVKAERVKKVEHDYEDEVVDVYFTTYVMQ